MNKHVKDLVQAFNPAVIQDDGPKKKLPQDVVNNILSEYPKTKQELIEIIKKRMAKEKKDPSKKVYKPFLRDIDTSEITDMAWLFDCFKNYTKPIILDLSTWDTSNVLTMRAMFDKCKSLISVDLSSFNTEKVTRMDFMFSQCENLKSIDLSGFDTSCVTNMECMLQNCFQLTEVDISHFNLDSLRNAKLMFNNCENLDICKVPNFLEHVNEEYVYNMFLNCKDSIIPDWYKKAMIKLQSIS